MKADLKSTRGVSSVLAVLFLACFLASLGLRLWYSARIADLVGPDHIAAGDDRVVVHLNGELLVLGNDGELRSRVRTPGGIDSHSLIDLRVLEDGRLLLARRRPAAVFLCEPQSGACSQPQLSVLPHLQDQYKVILDEGSGRLFFSDYGGRAWSEPLQGGGPLEQVSSGELLKPNDLALDAAHRLWIADSGNHRLAVFARNDSGWALQRTLPAHNSVATPNHDWPMMLSRAADGNWWVVQPDSFGKTAELLIYHPEGGAVARVQLPSAAYPTDVATLADAVIVTDMDSFQLYRIDVFSRKATSFGNAEVRRVLQEAAADKARAQNLMDLSFAAMIIFAVLMVSAAILATPADKRWKQARTAPPLQGRIATPLVQGEIYWLRRQPRIDRLLRWALPVSLTMAMLLSLQLGFVYVKIYRPVAHQPPAHWTTHEQQLLAKVAGGLLIFAWGIIGLPVLTAAGLRNTRPRLGTDGSQLLVALSDGRQLALSAQQLVYDRRNIACENRVFTVTTRKGASLYEAGEVNSYLAPILASATKMGPLGMLRYRLSHRDPSLLVPIVWCVGCAALLLATGLYKELWARLLGG